ncbi:MAG: phosphatase PAP2 family protein [Candidatus Hodarchaeota archaeon]
MNKRAAIGLAFVLAIGGYINTFLKGMVGLERPFQSHSNEVKKIGSSEGYSFPSGHSQATGAFWTYSSLEIKERPTLNKLSRILFYMAAISFLILVPLSRVYLGVHWPGDILVGVFEGILIAILYFWAAPRVWIHLKELSDRTQIASAILVTILMAVSSTIITSAFGHDAIIAANWELPGALAGFSVGLILEKRYVQFELPAPDQLGKITLRLIIGLILLVVIYYGLKFAVSPFEGLEIISGAEEANLMLLLDYIRLLIVGVAAAFGIPWVFLQIEEKLEIRQQMEAR